MAVAKPAGIVISCRLSQEAKAPAPKWVSVFGITSVSSFLHPLKALLPMLVTALPKVASVRLLHPLNR